MSVRESLLQKYPMLNKKCGAFVSLHKHGHLRGCIGHFGEDYPLHEIVAEMARAAAFEDPRFMPVIRDELDDIDIEISVLTPMRRIQSLDEFELHRHGIYIKKGYRSGTFLDQRRIRGTLFAGQGRTGLGRLARRGTLRLRSDCFLNHEFHELNEFFFEHGLHGLHG